MSFEISGKLHMKEDAVQVSERFTKREFVLEIEDGMYPQHVKFQLTQDKVSLLDSIELGEMLSVSFNIRGREYKNPRDGKISYFNNLNAWRIQKGNSSPAPTPSEPTSSTPSDFPSASDEPSGDFEELPF